MDAKFKSFLRVSGVSEAAIVVLEEELVLNSVVFAFLREEHFEKLLPKLKVGEHAALLKVWESAALREAETSSSPVFTRRGSSGSEASSRASSPSLAPSSVRFSPPTVRLSPPYQRSCAGQSSSTLQQKSFKELSQLYKAKALERVGAHKPKKEKEAPQMMMVILGGMIYDPILCRGVRKKYLHEPNPTKVELKRESSYEDVLNMAVSLYFEAYDATLDKLSLADSNGMPIQVASPDKWTLGAFYQNNGLQPSRYKLYVVLQSSEVEPPLRSEIKEKTEGDLNQAKVPATTCTEPVIKQCASCGRDYRTYIPDTMCSLPDGGSVFYSTPQTECPLCDANYFGAFMNEDLFPELQRTT